MKHAGWLLMLLGLLLSCEKATDETEQLGENATVLGTWVEDSYQDDRLWLVRAEVLDPSRYGFTLRGDGRFIEHKNAGWCGTPPITYANYAGTWEALSDSLLEVTVGYWGGTMNYQIRIVSLDGAKLAIRYLYGEDRAEAR